MRIIIVFLAIFSCYSDKEKLEKNNSKFEDISLTQVSNIGPDLQSYWDSIPNIKICDDVVSISKVERSIKAWERIGYKFGTISHEIDPSNCSRLSAKIGEIVIQLPSTEIPLGKRLALTKTYREVTSNVNLRAEIYITPYSAQKILILEHEIGHALGWSHINTSYHLMNPHWNKIGHSMSGLSYKNYIEKSKKFK